MERQNEKFAYLNPKMDVIDFSFDDIICASSCAQDVCPSQGVCTNVCSDFEQ